MLVPLADRNPTRSFPVLTILIIATCTVIYLFVQPGGKALLGRGAADTSAADTRFTVENAAIPCEVIQHRPLSIGELNDTFGRGDQTACETHPVTPPAFPQKHVWLAILYSMFLHGSLIHLGGNMLYFWVFGNNIEDEAGKIGFAVFYLAAGFISAVAHIAVNATSTVPVVGASGAIAGVMGAYLVLFPRVPIRSLIVYFLILFRDIEARWLLGFWFVSQFIVNPNEGIAWVAHVAGFIFGVLVGLVWRARRRSQPAAIGYSY